MVKMLACIMYLQITMSFKKKQNNGSKCVMWSVSLRRFIAANTRNSMGFVMGLFCQTLYLQCLTAFVRRAFASCVSCSQCAGYCSITSSTSHNGWQSRMSCAENSFSQTSTKISSQRSIVSFCLKCLPISSVCPNMKLSITLEKTKRSVYSANVRACVCTVEKLSK